MALKAKNANECKHHWYWAFLYIQIELLVVVASRILPNRRIYELLGKPRQEFWRIHADFWTSKLFLHLWTGLLGLSYSTAEDYMDKDVKFDHDLDTIFWNFCSISVHCAMSSTKWIVCLGILETWFSITVVTSLINTLVLVGTLGNYEMPNWKTMHGHVHKIYHNENHLKSIANICM